MIGLVHMSAMVWRVLAHSVSSAEDDRANLDWAKTSELCNVP